MITIILNVKSYKFLNFSLENLSIIYIDHFDSFNIQIRVTVSIYKALDIGATFLLVSFIVYEPYRFCVKNRSHYENAV